MKKFLFFFGALILFWLSFYSFHIFPWETPAEWWYIPHAITAVIINSLYLFIFSDEFL